MKQMILALALLLMLARASPGWAQTISGNLTAASGAGSTVQLSLNNAASVALVITGTWSATLQFEGTVDNSTYTSVQCYPPSTGTAATSTTANGTWQCNVAGMTDFRVRASALASGTAVVTVRGTLAFARSISGSGGAGAFLPLAGGTLTGQLVTDNLGIEFDESDTNPACAADNFTQYADILDQKVKICEDGTRKALTTEDEVFGNFTDNTVPVGNGTILEAKTLCDGGIISFAQASNTFSCTLTSATFLSALSDTLDLGGEASFELPNAAAPTTDAAGEIALDTTITDHQPLLQYFDGGENMSVIAIDTAELPALDNEIIKYDAVADKFVLEADAGGGSSATIRKSLFNWATLPDATGRAFFESYTVKATNDNFKHQVLTLNNPGAAENHGVYGVVEIPNGCTSTPLIRIYWTTTAITGTALFAFDYRAIGGDDTESLDQATFQEQIDISDVAPSATDERMNVTGALTAGNLAAGDTIEFFFYRDGTTGAPTDNLAAAVTVHGAFFECTEA